MDRSLVSQCGQCSGLFLEPTGMLMEGQIREACPWCSAPIHLSNPIPEAAVSWQFMHIIAHSGFSEVRRGNLRLLAETQMGPWQHAYRSL